MPPARGGSRRAGGGSQIHHHRQSGLGREMNDIREPDDDCPDAPPAAPGALVRVIDIVNQKGLHARASAKFVQTVERFDAEVRVTRCGETVGGTSIMGLMMLSAGPGTTIMVSAIGPEAQTAVDAITELVESKFNEEGT